MSASSDFFDKLACPPLADGCVDMPSYFSVPLQQHALRGLLAPERQLTLAEHSLWVEQTVLSYVLGQREAALAGAPRFLPPAFVATMNEPEGPEDTLPLTRFFAMLCRRMRPYDRSADTRSKEGRRRFYLELLVLHNIKMRLPLALVPDFIWAHLQEDLVPGLSHALAYLWRKLFPHIPYKPLDTQARQQFLAEAARAIAGNNLDPRLMPKAPLPPLPQGTDVLAPLAPMPVIKKDSINLLLWDTPLNVMAPLAAALEAALRAASLSFTPHRLPQQGRAGSYEGGINLLPIHPEVLADGMLAHGLAACAGRRNIVYAFWETTRLSDAARSALSLADEIWVPCASQASLFAGAPCPVRVVPLPLAAVHPAAHVTRDSLGLAEGHTVFLCVMDGPDSIARKNLLGAVEAFQHAFRNHEKVQLLIKSRGFNRALGGREEGAWARLRRRMQEDERILHFHEEFTPAEQAALLRCADAVVGLHRASPFSASLCEALAAGTPVIASACGRIHDVVPPESCFFVPVTTSSVVFDVAPVLERERGHCWHDPDLAEAAKAYRAVHADKPAAKARAAKASIFISSLSPQQCGAVMAATLKGAA